MDQERGQRGASGEIRLKTRIARQVTLARLLITPMPGVHALCDHLSPLLYVPVAPLELADALDWSAVPGLLDDPLQLNSHLCAIGAALRDT